MHSDPGPPPRRPIPPGQEQLNPGWVAAQRREERRLSLPLRLGCGGGMALVAVAIALGVTGLLNPWLTGAGVVAGLFLACRCGRGVWRGQQDLRGRLTAEERRVAKARAAQESQLFSWQEEHARRYRDWQARHRAFRGQLQWYGVALPAEIDRVDVAGGTLAGWSAMITVVAGLRLAAGGEVTVLDLSEGAVAEDLLAAAHGSGLRPLVWVLPGDLPRFDLGRGLPGEALADVLAVAAAAGGDPGQPADPGHDHAILERVTEVLGSGGARGSGVIGSGPSIGQVTAGLRVLAQVGDARADIQRGLLSPAQVDALISLYGRSAADGVITERALALEARLRKLETLGSAPAALPPSRLRVVALGRAGGVAGARILGSYVTAALTHLLRQQPRGEPWQHTILLAGAEKLPGDVLDRLSDACEASGTGLVLAYRSLPGQVRERLGRGNAALAVMRLGNAEDARIASEQIGTEHRFVLAQLTDTVGTSVSDTTGQTYASTAGTADSVATSTSASASTGHSGGRGEGWSGWSAFAPRTASRHQDASYSEGTSDSESITAGFNASTSWGWQTSQAVSSNAALARTTQRSREFLVEQHELQQLPPSAMLISYAAPGGHRVVLADADPGISGLPTATLHSLDEARHTGTMAPEPPPGGAGDWADVTVAGVGIAPSAFGAAGVPGVSGVPGSVPGPSPGVEDEPVSVESGEPARAESGAEAEVSPPPQPAAPSWAGPVPPPARDPAAAPISWREEDSAPPNLGPPPEPLDWRRQE